MKRILYGFLIGTSLSQASPQDDYYSGDLYRAIEEAKHRTHHYDYSHALRYNRSTSQSIPIPRLLNREMAQTIVETPQQVSLSPQPDDGDPGRTERPLNSEPLTTTTAIPSLSAPAATSVRVTVR